jgi:hypothetical protein
VPTDYYIDYALEEAFKHLKPVWMGMFKKNKDFLANDPQKALRLLRPFASQKELDAVEYFAKDDPLWRSFSYKALSLKDYEALSEVKAVASFRLSLEELSHEGLPENKVSAPFDSATAEIVIHLAANQGTMQYDKNTISVPAGKSISLFLKTGIRWRIMWSL